MVSRRPASDGVMPMRYYELAAPTMSADSPTNGVSPLQPSELVDPLGSAEPRSPLAPFQSKLADLRFPSGGALPMKRANAVKLTRPDVAPSNDGIPTRPNEVACQWGPQSALPTASFRWKQTN